MKVLIIGATGVIGKATVEFFEKENFSLRLFSRNIKKENYPDSIEVFKGDVFNESDLENAVNGCDAIHISLFSLDEALATEKIASVAKKCNIKLISFITGSTVEERNTWYSLVARHLKAENNIKNSGIPYIIFRPSWFFDTLKFFKYINRKPVMIGKQPIPYHWVALADFVRMVVTSYQKKEAWNKTFYILGPEKLLLKDVLLKYAQKTNPSVNKVRCLNIRLLKFIGFITGTKNLKLVASVWDYHEKTEELGDPTEANNILGAPVITFKEWLNYE